MTAAAGMAEAYLRHDRERRDAVMREAYLERIAGSPRVIEARERLEEGPRAAVLQSGDPDLLAAWCRSAAGEDDEATTQALLALLAPGDARLASAPAHLARLDRAFPR